MIKLQELEKLVEVTLFTGFIKDERPVSLLFVAEPESGKTELVKKARQVKSVLYLTDATAWGIIDKYWDDIESRKVRHIVIPDLTVPLGKATETRKTLNRFLSALIEEGIVDCQSFVIQKTAKSGELRCGLIATITPAAIKDQRAGWKKFGYMTRMLPVSYSYSTGTIDAIYNSIIKRQYQKEQPFTPNLSADDVEVTISEEFSREAEILARFLAQSEGTYGFRHHRQLQTLMMGSALYNGRNKVNKDDCDFITGLTFNYFNLDCKPI